MQDVDRHPAILISCYLSVNFCHKRSYVNSGTWHCCAEAFLQACAQLPEIPAKARKIRGHAVHNLVQNVNNSCGWQFCPSLLSTSDRIGLRAEKEMIPAFLSLRRNGKRLPGQHDLAQEAERLLFAAVAQHGQHIEKLAARVPGASSSHRGPPRRGRDS